MSDGASSSNLCLFSCEYWEVAWLSGQVVSDRQIYMDNDLQGMYFDTCICEKLWPRDVLIRDLITTYFARRQSTRQALVRSALRNMQHDEINGNFQKHMSLSGYVLL